MARVFLLRFAGTHGPHGVENGDDRDPDIRTDGWLDRISATYFRYTEKGYTPIGKFYGKYLEMECAKTLKEFFRFG